MTPARTYRSFAGVWFDFGVRFFVVGILASIAAIGLGVLPQMRVLGAVTLGLAVLGALVCMVGVRLYSVAGWRTLRSHAASVGESLRDATEAIGEPRQVAYARATGRVEPSVRSAPRVVWPV